MLILSSFVNKQPIFNENSDMRYYGNLVFGICIALGLSTIATGAIGIVISKKFNKKLSIAVRFLVKVNFCFSLEYF